MLLSPNFLKTSIYVAVIAGLVLGYFSWAKYQQNIGYQKAASEYQQKLIQAKDAADIQEAKWKTKYEAATHAAHEREKQLQSDIANISASNDRLHGTIKNLRSQLPANTAEANRAAADALAIVFGECVNEYQYMAAEAQRRASESIRLSESWPK